MGRWRRWCKLNFTLTQLYLVRTNTLHSNPPGTPPPAVAKLPHIRVASMHPHPASTQRLRRVGLVMGLHPVVSGISPRLGGLGGVFRRRRRRIVPRRRGVMMGRGMIRLETGRRMGGYGRLGHALERLGGRLILEGEKRQSTVWQRHRLAR